MKSRMFQANFFTDPFIQGLSLKQRWIYCYYLYNSRVNFLGCYEITDKTALFEIDANITAKDLEEAKETFTKKGKMLFVDSYVFIKNSEKYQGHLTNKQLIGTALKEFKDLPDEIKQIFISFKPEEVIEAYKSMFSLHGYELDCSLLGRLPRKLDGSLYTNTNTDINTNTNINTEEENFEKVKKIDFSKFEDLTDQVLQEIADFYEVPIQFVQDKHMDMEVWMGKSKKNRYKDYKQALMKWVRDDKKKTLIELNKAQSFKRGGVADGRNL